MRAPEHIEGVEDLRRKAKRYYLMLQGIINEVLFDRKNSSVLFPRAFTLLFLSFPPDGELLDNVLFIYDSAKDSKNVHQIGLVSGFNMFRTI